MAIVRFFRQGDSFGGGGGGGKTVNTTRQIIDTEKKNLYNLLQLQA